MAASVERTFVDTNVLLYSYDLSEPVKREQAHRVLSGEAGELVVSAQVLAEFYVNATRKLSISAPEARSAVAKLARLTTVSMTGDIVKSAIETSIEAQISFWDAQIIAAARASGCSQLLSEDLNAGQVIAGVRVVNPFE